MSINIEASDTELESPFFIRNKSIIDEWAAYNPSGIRGAVNGFYIDASLSGVCTTGIYNITGTRQLQNVTGSIPVNGVYVDRTTLEVESGLTHKEPWKIRFKTFHIACTSFFHNAIPTSFNPNLLIISSNQLNADAIQRRNDYAAMLSQHGLQKLTLKNGILTIELNRLVPSANELAILISIADTILQRD